MNETDIIKIGRAELLGTPKEIKHMTTGICNEVYELKYESNSFILRMNREKEWIYGTHRFLPLFKKLGINTPDIVSEDYSKTKFPFCYQILTRLDGEDLANIFPQLSEIELSGIAQDLSEIFDKFKSLPIESSFGGMTGLHEDKRENQLIILEAKKEQIIQRNEQSHVLEEEILDRYVHLLDKFREYFLNVRPQLYFDDMNSKNVMIHNGKFNGLVDLDFMMKGDILEGIGGIVAAWFGTKLGNTFIHDVFKFQALDEVQIKIAKAYGVFHLILWTSEEGIRFNSSSTGKINWSNVEQKRKKISQLLDTM